MKKVIKILVLLIAVGFVGIQFVRPNRVNPDIVESDTLEANVQVPDNIKKTFLRSCDDCHTNRSLYPWYSNIAPLSWKIVEHIEDGRKKLNFSVWKTYDAKKQKKKLNEVCDEVTSGEMPHSQYLYIHRDAILSEADKKEICDWTESEAGKL